MAKITDIDEAKPVTGDETLLGVQDGKACRVPVLGLLAAPQAADTIKVGERTLAQVIAGLEYPGMAITGLTVAPAQAEVGATVTANLTVTLSKNPTTQTVNGANLPSPINARTFAVAGVSATTAFVWNVTDTEAPGGPASDSRTATLTFLHKGHAGFIDKATAATLTAAEINGMSASWFASSVARTLNLVAGADGYLWFVQPASLAEPSGFKVNGFAVAAVKTTRNHTAATGAVASFNHYRLGSRLTADAAVTLEVLP